MPGTPRPNIGIVSGYSIGEDCSAGMESNLRAFDSLSMCTVADKDLATPPGSPPDGARYIVGAGATGQWLNQAGKIAVWFTDLNAWTFYTPKAGWRAFVLDEELLYVYYTSSPAGWRSTDPMVAVERRFFERIFVKPMVCTGGSDAPESSNLVISEARGPRHNFDITAANSGGEEVEQYGQDPMSFISRNHAAIIDGYWAMPSYYQAISVLESATGSPSTNGFFGIGCGKHLKPAGATVYNEEHIGLRYNHGLARFEFCVNSKTGPVGQREFIIDLGTPAALGIPVPTDVFGTGHAILWEMIYLPGIGVRVALDANKYTRLITDADMGGQDPFAEILANAYALGSCKGGLGIYAYTGSGMTACKYNFYPPKAVTYFIPTE